MTQMEKPRQAGRKWIYQGQPAVGRPGAALALLSTLGRHGCWARVVLVLAGDLLAPLLRCHGVRSGLGCEHR